jgi:MOSC domain-containing protein YiiM
VEASQRIPGEHAEVKTGVVEALHTRATRGAPMTRASTINVFAGRGIEGDRYFDYAQQLSRDPFWACAITLIEMESLEWLALEHDIHLSAGDSRRNIATRGVDLNALVGSEFSVGDVRLRGQMLCEPCKLLERHTGIKLVKQLLHRGGLRAEVLSDGVISVGDTVDPMPVSWAAAPVGK